MEAYQDRDSHREVHKIGHMDVTPGLSFFTGRTVGLTGDISLMSFTGLGRQQHGQCIAILLTLLMQFVLSLWCRGKCFSLTLLF